MKKAKKMVIGTIVGLLCTVNVFSQAAVLDIANLMNSIQQLYATYDQITTAIEQVQNTYAQLQKQAEMGKNMN